MHRQGFQLHELSALLAQCESSTSQLIVEGLYTHFAEAKNPRSGDHTRRQIKEFTQWIKAFHAAGLKPMTHASATGGALLYPAAHFDMVRIGIGMYGLWPSSEAERALSPKLALKPVLSWRAVVSEVKSAKKGDRVGYDLTEMLTRDTTLAVIPVGYWHGFPRLLSSKGRVLIHGKTARVVGRVSMDMIVVDVTDIPKVAPGDRATLIGKDGKEEIKASELAQFGATTHYEIITRLNPLMKRFY
jgi:alanine racemase